MKAFVGQALPVEFCFQPINTGLSDVLLKIYSEAGALESTSPMVHIVGGVYRASYLPASSGRKLLNVSSASLNRQQWTALDIYEADPQTLVADVYKSIFRKRVWDGSGQITIFDKTGASPETTFDTDGDLQNITPGNFTPKV